MARTDVGRAIDDAGRELARAAANVVERLAEEASGGGRSRNGDDPTNAPTANVTPAVDPAPKRAAESLSSDTSDNRDIRVDVEDSTATESKASNANKA
jgi:hypothetical protein